jgi:hypothetical protein
MVWVTATPADQPHVIGALALTGRAPDWPRARRIRGQNRIFSFIDAYAVYSPSVASANAIEGFDCLTVYLTDGELGAKPALPLYTT